MSCPASSTQVWRKGLQRKTQEAALLCSMVPSLKSLHFQTEIQTSAALGLPNSCFSVLMGQTPTPGQGYGAEGGKRSLVPPGAGGDNTQKLGLLAARCPSQPCPPLHEHTDGNPLRGERAVGT